MPGTLRCTMMGMTLMPAPTIEQTPVATRPQSPMSRASVVCSFAISKAIEKTIDPTEGREVYRPGPSCHQEGVNEQRAPPLSHGRASPRFALGGEGAHPRPPHGAALPHRHGPHPAGVVARQRTSRVSLE